jgi:hypothetical protein
MAPPPTHCESEPAPGEPSDVRFLARSEGYELALMVPRPSQASQPLVRLCFPGQPVEVVFTLGTLAAFSTHLQQLQDYLQAERARRPHHK